ncbi:RDD family protein [Flavobacterium pallidum]|nr:RDD family protein [Flavobacterium pallidum]
MENRNFVVTDDLLASKGQRFANYIIDLIVQYALVFAFSVIAGLIVALLGRQDILYKMQTLNRFEEYLIGAIFVVLYYGTMEMFLSRTVGKFITQTLVVMEDGSKPDKGTIMKRTFCRLIPFEQFSFFGERGWHDSIPDVYVVDKVAFEEARNLFHSFDEIGQREEI